MEKLTNRDTGFINPAVVNTLREAGYWILYPAICSIMIVVLKVYAASNSVIVIALITLFVMYLFIRSYRENNAKDERSENLHLVACACTSAILLAITSQTHPSVNPWGEVGWAISISIGIILTVSALFSERNHRGSWSSALRSNDTWTLVSILLLFWAAACEIYLY